MPSSRRGADGKLGPNMKRERTSIAKRSSAPAVAADHHRPPQPGEPIECGFMIGPGTMNAGGMPLVELARSLSPSSAASFSTRRA